MFSAKDTLNSSFLRQPLSTLWSFISPLYFVDEKTWISELIPLATLSEDAEKSSRMASRLLIETLRKNKKSMGLIENLLQQYSLDTQEGVVLMCLAEALLRIPDKESADALIKDKFALANWSQHLVSSQGFIRSSSAFGLTLASKLITPQSGQKIWQNLTAKYSMPVIRQVLQKSMKIMGHQFVLGRDINEALHKSQFTESRCRYSYDMLGEAAATKSDADSYYTAYQQAIESVGAHLGAKTKFSNSISIKLSALHPRYEVAQSPRLLPELVNSVLGLIRLAREKEVPITIDAEEANRLELSLEIFKRLYEHPDVKGWGKLGIVVQAYSKRALAVLAWLAGLSQSQGDCIPVRLVKGAYWDSEIKWAQQGGYQSYPVYTLKASTDVSYLACARFMLSESVSGLILPQFATHNVRTICSILSMVDEGHQFEFQRLHGMGGALYHEVMKTRTMNLRIYAPVGEHKDLLPYLVRRLLENGANSSFIHQIYHPEVPIDSLIASPVDRLSRYESYMNTKIPLPSNIFNGRVNSNGLNLMVEAERSPLLDGLNAWYAKQWQGASVIDGVSIYETMIKDKNIVSVTAPFDRRKVVGSVQLASLDHVSQAIDVAANYSEHWRCTKALERKQLLNRLADLFEQHKIELVALCQLEAGKTIQDSLDEIREAIDFCRYYAAELDSFDTKPSVVLNPSWSQKIKRTGLGVIACISPWNFPLAIFIGQIVAALASGNTVVAKPAEQTCLIAVRAVELMLLAGFPNGVIQLLLGGGDIGSALVSDMRIEGVAFTGSTLTAKRIEHCLADRGRGPVPFIAETGGQNAMIVDSTALPEQVVRDVIRSAFSSAGQRCSALRLLCLQQNIAPKVMALLRGALAELSVGSPCKYSTDIGPVIDSKAKEKLIQHIKTISLVGKDIAQLELPPECVYGDFVAPTIVQINDINQLTQEHFGPVLHVVTFKQEDMSLLVDQINQLGFGLTLGIHSRNESMYRWLEHAIHVGNCYINRDQVGAVVGVQPFGGHGLSGTGPKAGGANYLYRFSRMTVNNMVGDA